MLVSDEHLPIGNVGKSMQSKQLQQPFGWVFLEVFPFRSSQLPGFVDGGRIEAHLAHVVKKRAQSQLVQLKPCQTQTLSDHDAEDAHVDGMGECVFVEVT